MRHQETLTGLRKSASATSGKCRLTFRADTLINNRPSGMRAMFCQALMSFTCHFCLSLALSTDRNGLARFKSLTDFKASLLHATESPLKREAFTVGDRNGISFFFFCENLISFKRLPHTQQSTDMVVSSIFLCGSKILCNPYLSAMVVIPHNNHLLPV